MWNKKFSFKLARFHGIPKFNNQIQPNVVHIQAHVEFNNDLYPTHLVAPTFFLGNQFLTNVINNICTIIKISSLQYTNKLYNLSKQATCHIKNIRFLHSTSQFGDIKRGASMYLCLIIFQATWHFVVH
jgi:hypothetical protein